MGEVTKHFWKDKHFWIGLALGPAGVVILGLSYSLYRRPKCYFCKKTVWFGWDQFGQWTNKEGDKHLIHSSHVFKNQ